MIQANIENSLVSHFEVSGILETWKFPSVVEH
jgi:hypothetical protein